MEKDLISRLDKKEINGETMYFYAGLGWVTKERLSQPNIIEYEKYKGFMSSKDNILNCDNCPENRNENGTYKCGQQHCWVDIHTKG